MTVPAIHRRYRLGPEAAPFQDAVPGIICSRRFQLFTGITAATHG
jgi:hypothetical protein